MRAPDWGRDSRANAATPHGIWERQNEAQTSRNPRDGRLGDSIARDPPAIRPKAGWNPQNVQSGQPGEHVDPRGGDDHLGTPDDGGVQQSRDVRPARSAE